ncbi:cell division protein FtsQ/DivIB [Lewinella sp. 4G2]|uniref:cell division protein FtsQ/DivIB n=1 Tax=Lewinella sp. 4G2 TaxID=1803372 RepID=UPI0007B4A2F8|nr:hypothetical protein [Lewinella sp. 4G2]OAV44782.1 hypothetical protein A3850_009905 [Lewinella sp. 4G2]
MAKQKQKLPLPYRLVMGIKSYGWIFITLAIAVIAMSAIGTREASHVQTVAPVVMPLPDGSALVTPEQLLEKLSASFTKPLSALSLADIDIKRVEDVLENQAFVADADAFVDDDLQLNIIVTQQVPLLRVIAENGQNYYLDENGLRMPLSENYTARVPVVTGNIVLWSDDFMEDSDNQLYQLVQFARHIRADEFLNALVEQVYVNTAGEWVLAPKVGDQIIHLGRYHEMTTVERLERLKTFYREGVPYEGWRKYKSFDLRYNDQVVARKN